MSQKTKDILFQVFPVILLAVLSVVAIIFAWTEPTQAPPGGNVPAPLNVSALHQTKLGALSVTTLFDTNNPAYFIDPSAPISAIFSGNVTIGTTTPPLERLDVAGAIKISDTPSPCDASRRGTIKFISGAAGTADCLAVCKRKADGTFAWSCIDVGVGIGVLPFKYRRPITISNPGSSLTDYQISITLDTASLIAANKIRADCGDIRVTDSDGSTFLLYFLGRAECNSSSTRIWVKVPSIPPGTKTIYLYYGNSSIRSDSQLWYNIKHLNIFEGVFNYNASLGVGGFHSREMQHRLGVATSRSHTCALLTNGNIDCWGRNDFGQAADYLGGNAIGVDVGAVHTCALLTNGNIDCWGLNTYDQAADYFGGNAVGVATGDWHTCALLTNGNVDCWGYTGPDYTGGNAIGVDAGSYHTCALLTNGNIDCWGRNDFGQAADYLGGNAIGVAAGPVHTCALLSNGDVYCWGDTTYDQHIDYTGGNAIGVSASVTYNCILLPNGNIDCWGGGAYRPLPKDYFGGNAIGVVTAGDPAHFCALLTNGNVDCWGNNGAGQGSSRLPGRAIRVSTRHSHGCALLANGNIDCWGRHPGADYTQENAISVAAGGYHTCALLPNGNIDCWGWDDWGQAADYTGGNATSVAAGYYHTCALLTNGNIDCWGCGGGPGYNYGQCTDYFGGNAIGVAAGRFHTCALLANGNIDCWGYVPTDYLGGNAIGVAAGRYHTCALLTNGNIDCWGDNSGGQAADYLGGNATSVAAGYYHTCALLTNGNIDCWGCSHPWNFYDVGQCTDYFGGNAIGVAAGESHTCALLTNGNVNCWGSSHNGETSGYIAGEPRNPFRKYAFPEPTTTVGPEESLY